MFLLGYLKLTLVNFLGMVNFQWSATCYGISSAYVNGKNGTSYPNFKVPVSENLSEEIFHNLIRKSVRRMLILLPAHLGALV